MNQSSIRFAGQCYIEVRVMRTEKFLAFFVDVNHAKESFIRPKR